MEKTKKQNPQMNQNQIENTNLQEKQFEKEAMKVSTVSIVVNVLLSLFKLLAGVIAHSGAMISDAIHSASDVFSTIIVMVGIHLAGRKSDKEHPYGHERMECVAAIVLVICVFIEKAALDIFKDAINKMVDKACDEDTEQAIRECAEKQPGVIRVDMLKTRVFGNKIYVDLEIGADGNETLREAHAVAEEVHNRIENEFPKVKHIMVHVNPA